MKERYYRFREQYRWKKKLVKRGLFFLFVVWYIQSLPDQLFNDPYSTVILAKDGRLMGAHIASDGQWRFPESKSVPAKIETCIVAFEDQNFYWHLGFSIKGMGRALVQNMSNGKVVSGGSTITQQVIRLMRKNPPRTYTEKLYELLLATRLEWRYPKKEILRIYVSHAPFGNNVVGLEAASWRYFGRKPEQLSWAESATLAVLPNAPGLIYPGKNHDALKAKRDRLLKMLYANGTITKMSYLLALEEELPNKPLPLPQTAEHLMQQCRKLNGKGRLFQTTLDYETQQLVNREVQNYALRMEENDVHNISVLVTSSETGEVLAYVGNTSNSEVDYHTKVDCIQAPRSTGSILKPLLYAKAMEDGLITPKQLLPDVPSRFGAFSPVNFNHQFEGAIPANKALAKSLNIPFVYLLRTYGQPKFHADLKRLNFKHINRKANHYGLSLILGGAEANSWQINECYNLLAQSLTRKAQTSIHFLKRQKQKRESLIDKGCVYSTFEALVEVNRPDEENNWRAFESGQKIAWKTGTSFGFRDAWAVGVTPKYTITVWVGNADGEGRSGLTGVKAAAPLLFSIFRKIPTSNNWFPLPKDRMSKVSICTESGNNAGRFCPKTRMERIPTTCLTATACPFHQLVHLNKSRTYRVNTSCAEYQDMIHESWFILPPLMERYYSMSHAGFSSNLPFDPNCTANNPNESMHFVYPKPDSKLYIPIEIQGTRGKVIVELAHRRKESTLYWHLDDVFIGSTSEVHQLSIQPEKGKHQLVVVDETGLSISCSFEIL